MRSEAHFALLVFPFLWRDTREGLNPGLSPPFQLALPWGGRTVSLASLGGLGLRASASSSFLPCGSQTSQEACILVRSFCVGKDGGFLPLFMTD